MTEQVPFHEGRLADAGPSRLPATHELDYSRADLNHLGAQSWASTVAGMTSGPTLQRAARDQAGLADALATVEEFNGRLAAGRLTWF
jgi:hypothetical protein